MRNEIVLKKHFRDNFGADISGFSEFPVILVVLSVFLGSRGAAEGELFPKQTIHFRDHAKGEDEELF